jgi:hypothetical protein
MSAPTTTTTAAQRLGQRLREMHDVIEALRLAEQDAVSKRHLADVEEYKAFLRAQGSMELRKVTARLEVERFTFDADVAEANVRHLVRSLREADKRVDVGRTFSADLRAEYKVLGQTDETQT